MSTTYQPLGNTILVESVPVSTTIAIPGGIPGSGRYTVIAIGDGEKVPFNLKEGDVVIISDMGAVPVTNTNYSIVNVESVLAIVIEDEK